jgi:hypothetical protein
MANQMVIQDTFLFAEYLKASRAPDERLAEFYAGKFSPELKQACKALKEQGIPDGDPFATNLYKSPLRERAEVAQPEGERLWYECGEAAETSHRYTLISVLLATALFFGGTAPRFERPKKRYIVLMLGLAAIVGSVVMFVNMATSRGAWFVRPQIPTEFIRP